MDRNQDMRRFFRVGWTTICGLTLVPVAFFVLAATVAPGAVTPAVGTSMGLIICALILAAIQVYDALVEDGQ